MSTVLEAGNGWDPRGPVYKCCCGSCHAKTGAFFVGVLSLLFALLNFLNHIRYVGLLPTLVGDADSAWPFYVLISCSAIDAFVQAVVSVALICGLRKEVSWWLSPWLVWQALRLLFLLLLIMAVVVMGFLGSQVLRTFARAQAHDVPEKGEERDYGLGEEGPGQTVLVVVLCVLLVLSLLIGIWWLFVVFAAKRYLNDLEKYGADTATASYSASQQPKANK